MTMLLFSPVTDEPFLLIFFRFSSLSAPSWSRPPNLFLPNQYMSVGTTVNYESIAKGMLRVIAGVGTLVVVNDITISSPTMYEGCHLPKGVIPKF